MDFKLYELLKAFMIDAEKKVSELIGSEKNSNAPLATFSARIKACYCLGLISEKTRHDLDIIRNIRNLFAHKLQDLTFDDEKVISYCNSLKIPKPFIMIPMNSHRDRFVFSIAQLSTQLGMQVMSLASEKRKVRKGF